MRSRIAVPIPPVSRFRMTNWLRSIFPRTLFMGNGITPSSPKLLNHFIRGRLLSLVDCLSVILARFLVRAFGRGLIFRVGTYSEGVALSVVLVFSVLSLYLYSFE